MKNYFLVGALALILLSVPTITRASTLSDLRAEFGKIFNTSQTAAANFSAKGVSTKNTTDTFETKSLPVTETTNTLSTNGCAPVSVPAGKAGWTVRCDGANWVADGALINTGDRLKVGPLENLSFGVFDKVSVMANSNAQGFAAVGGYNHNGAGVQGWSDLDSNFGVGVVGVSNAEHGVGVKAAANSSQGKAVEVQQLNTGYGVYQEGAEAKNYFEGRVGIGMEPSSNPNDKLSIRAVATNSGATGIGASVETSNSSGFTGTAVSGVYLGPNMGGTGVWGSNAGGLGGVGVRGSDNTGSGTAVRADQSGTGYGFYQAGPNAKNLFEGTVQINGGNPGVGKVLTSDRNGLATWEVPVTSNAVMWGAVDAIDIENTNPGKVKISDGAVSGKLLISSNPDGTPSQKLEVAGGIRIHHDYSKPLCSIAANTQGTMWFQRGGTNSKDTFEICAKDAAGAYAWRTLY